MESAKEYLAKIERALAAGNATEHTHRPALKDLMESLRGEITATNEPSRIECGSPDFIITRRGVPVGYIEAKDVGTDLSRAEETEQIGRYLASLRNLILTDYLEFRLYRNGESVRTARLARFQKSGGLRREPGGTTEALSLLQAFLDAEAPVVTSARELAERMARLARLLRDLIVQAFAREADTGDLHAQYEAFRLVLIGDLSSDQFADMYAQTIVYGLFAARCNHIGARFSRELAGHDLPRTNPFLRRFFNTIAGPDLDQRISWVVDDLAELLAKADMDQILADFGRSTLREDPVVHFYETFLAAYDPRLRDVRGVYYTPEPVVDYIVRSVDELLKRDFKLDEGIADASRIKFKRKRLSRRDLRRRDGGLSTVEETYETHRVQILDPACGTGTFLHFVIAHIRERFKENAGLWPSYVTSHLLPRLFGFELLMAPYAVAHMKLGLQLRESGYDFHSDERLRVFLTNTLEEAHEMAGLPLFTQWLAEEAAAAGEVKQLHPIMVIIGNPPYSGHSLNHGAWINRLLDDYKQSEELKKPAQAKWLSDDYVKFIRFAQWRIEQTGYGILAFVTNHSYLENPTFFDMRASLMVSFDDLYVLDLHGSSKPKETSPTGRKNQNVFDIQKGVAITLLVRRSTRAKASTVRRADVWGSRAEKYEWLNSHSVLDTPWEDVTPEASPWYFVKEDRALKAEYEQGWSVADIFRPSGDPAPGIVTTHDEFAISWSPEEAAAKVERLLATASEIEAREIFTLCSQSQWSYETAKSALSNGAWRSKATPVLYRPFDVRWTIWDSNVAVHRRERVMRHLLETDTIALVTNRQVNGEFTHAFVTDKVITDCTLSTASKERSYAFPLYILAHDLRKASLPYGPTKIKPNLAAEYVSALAKCLGGVRPAPADVFAYIYAVLNSPAYRAKYRPFLRRGFPRIPLPANRVFFERLATLGHHLVDSHLLRKTPPARASYPEPGDNHISRIKFIPDAKDDQAGKIYINRNQYIDRVPGPAWELAIGGYQVAQKWLRDRKGRMLTFDELQQYLTIIEVLSETMRIQGEIDRVLETGTAVASTGLTAGMMA